MINKKDIKELQSYANYEPFISIVIPTYNEEKYIEEKLRNILSISYPLNKMEIIIVDSSTDNTPNIVKNWMKKYSNIILLRETERRGLAAALNLAYSKARGEIIIKSDCDTLLDRESVRQIISNFSNTTIGAVSGKHFLINDSKHEKGYSFLADLKKIVESRIDSIYILDTFSAFRRDLIEPIDEKSVADDAELGLKIRRKGYKVIFDPKACFYERQPLNIIKRLKIKQRRAQGHIKLLLKNLDILFNPKYGKYGFLIFPLNFCMMIVNPWLLVIFTILFPIIFFQIFGACILLIILIFYSLLFLVYLKGWVGIVAGFIESQLALISGFLRLALKGPEYIWGKI